MNIETLEIAGIQPAIRAMRNPMDSWDKSDSIILNEIFSKTFSLGVNDTALSRKLTNSGSEHCKHLRMIHVWADLNLPRYIWSEFDTYKFNTKVSSSSMHCFHKRLLTEKDFENEEISKSTLNELNSLIEMFNSKEQSISKGEIRTKYKRRLPEGFLQLRTLDLNYAELLSIYSQRKNHRLLEWRVICEWIINLPKFRELTGVDYIV